MRRHLLVLLVGVLSAGACKAEPPAQQAAPAPTKPEAPAPAPAPEAAPDPPPEPEFLQAGPLYYVESVTAGADPDAALPMIVAIHGLGDDPRNFVGLLADFDRPARLILPRAVDPWEGGDGWSWFPVRARDQDPEGLGRGIASSADVIAEGLQELTKSRPTVGKPIVTGFSQGGMLTFALGVHHPELFGAAYPVGGWLPPPLWPQEVGDPTTYPPIVALHGDADPAVKIEPTRESVAQLQKLGLKAELHEYPGIRHAIPPSMRQELHQLLRDSLPSDQD